MSKLQLKIKSQFKSLKFAELRICKLFFLINFGSVAEIQRTPSIIQMYLHNLVYQT